MSRPASKVVAFHATYVRRRLMDGVIWLLSRPSAYRIDRPAPRLTADERFAREAEEHTKTLARLRRALGKED